jgi:hypothetical protein
MYKLEWLSGGPGRSDQFVPSNAQRPEVLCKREPPRGTRWTKLYEDDLKGIDEQLRRRGALYLQDFLDGRLKRQLRLLIAKFLASDELPLDVERGAPNNHHKLALLVALNGGAMLTGMPGTGKTHFLDRHLNPLLRRLDEKVRIVPLAITHSASRLLRDGRTVAHGLHRYNTKPYWFEVDEASIVPVSTWAKIARWLLLGSHFVISGDFEGQLSPIMDEWREMLGGRRADDFQFMRDLTSSLHVVLTRNRRADGDDAHFQHLASLYPHADESLKHLVWRHVLNAVERYPWDGVLQPEHTFVRSHCARLSVNALFNRRDSADREFAVVNKAAMPGAACQPQEMMVWPGLEMMGYCRRSDKCPVYNGVVYTVKSVGDGRMVVDMLPRYRTGQKKGKKPETDVALTFEEASKHLRLTYAFCYSLAQGQTFADKHVLLLDTHSRRSGEAHEYFSVRHLIVGLSRVTHGSFAHVATPHQQATLLRRPYEPDWDGESDGADDGDSGWSSESEDGEPDWED